MTQQIPLRATASYTAKPGCATCLARAFTKAFPYLKLEIADAFEGDPASKKAGGLCAGSINMDMHQTVQDFMNEVHGKTSKRVKIYRRFCNVWVETLLTDDWTLAQQNAEGELLSKLNEDAANREDYAGAPR